MAHFIEEFWKNNSALWNDNLITRFPPEPNGRLHLGHLRSIWLNMSMANAFGGKMHLRMDDTNPEKEDVLHEYAIIATLNLLGVSWTGNIRYASDHFHAMHTMANACIRSGLAFVDTSSKETISAMRGDLHTSGTRSKDAENSIAWHLDMFEKMTAGDFPDGGPVLRAKINMSAPNINLRDPILYRVKHIEHVRTGAFWCVYPTYDFAHPFCDVAEGVALSLCTLEFEDHRPLYDWVCEYALPFAPTHAVHKPVELEFARLEITNGLTSKRKINALVSEGRVDGWDDPRLLTLDALARRGFPPHVLFKFIEDCGISRSNSELPFSRLEDTLRLELDATAVRRVLVLDPVELTISGSTMDTVSTINNHPKNTLLGTREFGFSSSVYVERDDIRLPGKVENGFKRLELGACVRLMNMDIVTVTAIDDADGRITKVYAEATPDAKPRATIHALSISHALKVDVVAPSIIGSDDTPESCMRTYAAVVEPGAMDLLDTFHAIRVGYAVVDCNNRSRLILTTGLKKGF